MVTKARVALLLAAVCMTHTVWAQEKSFDVPASDAVHAIPEFARQAGLQIVAPADGLKGITTPAIKGTLDARAALKRLLVGTGLEVASDDGTVITLRKVSKKSGTTSTTTDLGPPAGAGLAAAQLEEVVVTGSRIPTTAQEQVLPVRSYTREDIERSGQITMGEFLNTLPDVSNFTPSLLLGYPGVQAVQLHGLPLGTALTLLDGRRLETSTTGFFDLSNIPLAAVERIEIVPVGASAIYGADALAGAVNTILRKNFNGFEANATLDHASGVNNASGNIAWGKSWERGSVSLIGSYQETGALLGAQREPTSLTSLPANIPASVASAIESTSCVPGNVYSVDGSNLPGLSSPEAAIPAGITGRPTIGQFAATAGKQNLCNAERYADITPQSSREGALLSAHYDVAESVDLFTEVLFSHKYLRSQVGPQLNVAQSFGGTVAANNPYNPFGEAVNVSFAYPGAGQQEVQSTSLIRPLIGVRGSFSSDWHYEATAYLSEDHFHDVNMFSDFLQKVPAALASSSPATALNPFTSGVPGTPQLLSSFLDASDTLADDRIVNGQALLRGPVLQLPAGALQTAIGGEYSQEMQYGSVTGTFGSPPVRLHRNTYAAFSETRIPLLAGGEASQRSERLALTLAGRYDHSNDYGGKATWQSGLLWRATEALSFRASYGVSYQAPHLNQISGPQTADDLPLLLPDPFRGNQLVLYPVTQVFGPNFNLKPQTGDSFTLGLEYSSQALPGLHTSLTWYDLKISNYISNEAQTTLLANPNLFPGAVIRAPPTPQDQQQGFLGLITQINDTYYNFGDLRVAGFDADISYAIDTRAGQFTPSVAIANIYKWQSAVLPGTPAMDELGMATTSAFGGGVGWALRWKGTAALAWKQGPLSMNLAGRYIGRYLDYQLFVPNTNEIGNSWIFDFNARYEAGQAFASTNPWLAHAYVALGAVNLFNKTPPFSYTPYYYDIQQYDIRGRFLHLDVGVRF
jgi:iron complex outermembrane recepter protein